MNKIRDPNNPREQVVLTVGVARDLVQTARDNVAYSASWHVQAMADAIELLTNEVLKHKRKNRKR